MKKLDRNDDHLQKKWLQPKKIHDAINPPVDPGISFEGDPGLTDQSQARDCDVNVIVERFMKTGQLPQMIAGNPEYGQFDSATDYHEAMNTVLKAQEQFDALDARVRARFENDPEKFLAFATDNKNKEEMEKLGLAIPSKADPLLEETKGLREDLKKHRESEKKPNA